MIVNFPYKRKDGKRGNYQAIVLGHYGDYFHAIEIAGRAGRNVVRTTDVDKFAQRFGLKHVYRLGRYKALDIPKIDFRRSAKRVYQQVIKSMPAIGRGYRTFLWREIASTITLQDPVFGSNVMRSLFPKPGDPIKMLDGTNAKVVTGYPLLKVQLTGGEFQVVKHHIKTADDAGRPLFIETKGFTA